MVQFYRLPLNKKRADKCIKDETIFYITGSYFPFAELYNNSIINFFKRSAVHIGFFSIFD